MTILIPRQQRLSRHLFDYAPRFGLERNVVQAINGLATFTRAGTAMAVGSNGVLRVCTHSEPRYHWVDLDGDGVRESVALLLEDARTNLLLRSQEFDNATWAKSNITATADAIAAPDGTLTADKMAATATAATSLNQSATVAATNATYSVYIKKGSGATDANEFGIRNATTATNLLFVTLNHDTLAITYTTGASGASVENIGNGWYRLTLTVTAGISSGNSVTCYAGFVGNSVTAGKFVYLWGAQLEAAPVGSSYIPTAAGTASRVADALTFALNILPRSMTAYAKFVEYGTIATGGTSGVLGIGAHVNPAFYVANDATGHYQVQHVRAGSVSSTAAAAPTLGQVVEVRAVLNADGSVQFGQSIAGAAEVVAAASAANALAAAWNDTTLTVNSIGGASTGFAALLSLRIAAGVQTLATMREGP